MFYKVSNGGTVTDLGSSTSLSVNLKNTRADYASLTVNDFIVEVSSGMVSGSSASAASPLYGWYTLNKAYNASTGVFTCSATIRAAYYNVDISKSLTCHAYLIK